MADIMIPLIDKEGNFIRYEEKVKVHREGLFHPAFSLILFNSANQMIIQQRADEKYHCPGELSNTCCGHPKKEKVKISEVGDRLYDEMRISSHNIQFLFDFKYYKKLANGLIENEWDFVFVGTSDDIIFPNHLEVKAFMNIENEALYSDIKKNPDNYTYWFKEILNHEKFKNYMVEKEIISNKFFQELTENFF